MSERKQVSKEEFDKFLDDYPRQLKSGVTSICEPPIRHYLDESLPTAGELGSSEYFSAKVVASVKMSWLGPDGEVDRENTGEFWTYSIREDLV